jgi:hypothetical protein
MVAAAIKRATKAYLKNKKKKDPKPKFKAKRKLDSEVEKKLAKQTKETRAAKPTKSKRAFAQTAKEKAADREALRKKKDPKAAAKAKVEAKNKEVAEVSIRKPRAKVDTTPADKKPQSSAERQRRASGNVRSSVMRRKPGQGQPNDRKQGVGSMVSYTSLSRAKAIQKAGEDLRSGKITQSRYDAIMKAIDKKDTAESTSRKLKGASNRRTTRKIYDPSKDMPFNKGGMPKKNHAKPGSYSKAYMMGGMAKKKK